MNDSSYINDYTPPTPVATQPATRPTTAFREESEKSQLLEDQNIFTLLGVEDGTEAEKSAFLDELQQVIWEDFLENDVSLLVLDSEHQKLTEIIGDTTAKLSIETQEKVIEYLEELIPDLEEIMVDKAVRLKAELVRERIESLKKLHQHDSGKMEAIFSAESLSHSGEWASVAEVLNRL